MSKLRYRTTGDNGVEWQAVDDAGEPLGDWKTTQQEAREDLTDDVQIDPAATGAVRGLVD
jgi:hypothetical protein